jgi:uncharacterized coiled-coil protein SlyX
MNLLDPGLGEKVMDPKFLEFWGELLLGAAKGQRQLKETADWMNQGFSSFGDMGTLFRRAYGLEAVPEKSPAFPQQWEKASEAFRSSMKEYCSLLGVVTMKEHMELQSRYEETEKKVAEREERIRRLEALLAAESLGREPLQEDLRKLVGLQTEQFTELMRNLGFDSMKS